MNEREREKTRTSVSCTLKELGPAVRSSFCKVIGLLKQPGQCQQSLQCRPFFRSGYSQPHANLFSSLQLGGGGPPLPRLGRLGCKRGIPIGDREVLVGHSLDCRTICVGVSCFLVAQWLSLTDSILGAECAGSVGLECLCEPDCDSSCNAPRSYALLSTQRGPLEARRYWRRRGTVALMCSETRLRMCGRVADSQ